MLQEIIEILILSAIQGISEFLPISSSAHLILASNFYDFKTGSLLIDISLHLGSLLAIIFYFKKDLFDLKSNKKLLQLIIIGSIPLIIFGYILHSTEIIYLLRSTNLNIKSIIFIGLFQILALIPGVSRAGITLTAARFLKFNRVDASKISFLLSIPALSGASFLGLKDLFSQNIEINYLILLAICSSFIFSYMTVKFFLIYINRFSLNLFVFYRVLVAIALLVIIYY